MSMSRTLSRLSLGALAGALALAGATPLASAAQDEVDARWLPWLGCWTASEEPSEASGDLSALLCVRPAQGEDAVQFANVVDQVVESVDLVSATGQRRDTNAEGCEGWESGTFSADGHRIYLRSDEACIGGRRRTSTSILAWAERDLWLDIEIVDVDGEEVAWVRRYRPATQEQVEAAGFGDIIRGRAMAVITARTGAAERLSVEDIIEASGRVDQQAVVAWIAEVNDPLRLDADALIRMADAGVPEEVIDIAIAVSNPDRFQLARADGEGEYTANERSYTEDLRPRHAYGRSYYSLYLDPFYYGSYGFGYRYSRFGFSPFGYSPYYYSPYSGFGGFGPIIVERRTGPFRGVSGGRVVRGRGYTRSSGGSTGREARSVNSRERSGSSSGSSASSSRSGSSRRAVRRAKPRGGGHH